MKVKITYYKYTGKFYTEEEIDMEDGLEINEVWNRVKKMMEDGKWPGLTEGNNHYFFTTIDAPDAENSHPRMIVPRSWIGAIDKILL